jgi:hypothetical protein
MEAIAMANESNVLFPNLKELIWHAIPFPPLEFLIGPNTHQLSLHVLEDSSIPLAELASKHPHLQHVKIKAKPSSTKALQYQDAIQSLVRGLSALRVLDIDAGNAQTLNHLATLPMLHQLAIRLTEDNLACWKDFDPFPSLEKLRIYRGDLSRCISFLNNLSPHSMLHNIGIEASDTLHDNSQLRNLLKVAHSSSFPNVTRLVLGTWGMPLDDEGAAQIAMAWPSLISLKIYDRRAGRQHSRHTVYKQSPHPSLTGLVSFSQYCPHLQCLSIEINALNVPSTPPEFLPNKSLTIWNAGASEIGDLLKEVAGFLSDIFPSLRTIRASQDDWNEVQAMLGGEDRSHGGWD